MRLHNATAMRLLAAWFVLLEHSPRLLGRIPWNGTEWGWWGLAIFFSLSGYMVSQSAKRSLGPVDFALRRVRRLGPAYAAAMIGVVVIVWPLFSRPQGFPTPQSGGEPLLAGIAGGLRWNFPDLFRTHAYPSANGSTWSLPYEILMYCLLGVVWFAWLRRTRLHPALLPGLTWSVTTILLLCGRRFLPGDEARFLGFRIFYVVQFLAVFSGGWTLAEWHPSPRILSLLLVLTIVLRASFNAYPDQANALDALLVPLAVVALGLVPLWRNRFLPDWSYGFYLWAWPVQQCLVDRLPRLGPLELTLCATAATLPLAALSWYAVERPFLRSRRI
jgi:peptidoglycan/LPS O-acetylase OafA/YrhL